MNNVGKITTLSLVMALGTALSAAAAPLTIFDGKLGNGLDMGVDSEKGSRTWVNVNKDGLCLNYPGGQKWAAMFITVGKPKAPPRPGQDLSKYSKISFEIKGKKGKEAVFLGLKDNTDADSGKEVLVPVRNITTAWKKMEFPLSQFKSADLKNIYVPMELAFGNAAADVCVRNIQYLEK